MNLVKKEKEKKEEKELILTIESIDLSDLPAFMIAPQKGDPLRVTTSREKEKDEKT